ncbi:MAG: P-II family nitrogen regulator [Candidatus Marinimicrobia bacterium]|nr:P-II family nitrogen regulator [Candidatus Neomarinimicrobiota bacterium]
MKLIIAIIQPEELPSIKEALVQNKIYKFTVSNALGQGMEIPINEVYRGIAHDIKLLKKVRLEIAVTDEFVDVAVDAISEVARGAGDVGRGKIFILPIEECIRIRTGERGEAAIG